MYFPKPFSFNFIQKFDKGKNSKKIYNFSKKYTSKNIIAAETRYIRRKCINYYVLIKNN